MAQPRPFVDPYVRELVDLRDALACYLADVAFECDRLNAPTSHVGRDPRIELLRRHLTDARASLALAHEKTADWLRD